MEHVASTAADEAKESDQARIDISKILSLAAGTLMVNYSDGNGSVKASQHFALAPPKYDGAPSGPHWVQLEQAQTIAARLIKD